MALDPVTSQSRSVALQLEPDSVVLAGNQLRFDVAPEATASARSLFGQETTASESRAYGLGAGDSRFYSGGQNEVFFDSNNLAILSGGNSLVTGKSIASALSASNTEANANAEAINIALADVDFYDQYGGTFQIGLGGAPLSAFSRASSQQLDISPQPLQLTSNLSSNAIARGLEGKRSIQIEQQLAPETNTFKAASIGLNPTDPSNRPVFFGQPIASVEAQASLSHQSSDSSLNGSISADAVAIEGYEINNTTLGDNKQTASVIGSAKAAVATDFNAPLTAEETLLLTINAEGISDSMIRGAANLDTTVDGFALGLAETVPQGSNIQRANASGINASTIITSAGNDYIRGRAGIALPSADPANEAQATNQVDAVGINNTWISSGAGNDTIHASILTESDVSQDINGDGLLSADVYLEAASMQATGMPKSSGFRNSYIYSGTGNDAISGSSQNSFFMADAGNDNITLDHASASSFWGGLGDDVLSSSGPSLNNTFFGGSGNDNISVSTGTGNILDGGLGQDQITAGEGSNTIAYMDAAAAYRSASISSLSGQLAESSFWNDLSELQKQELWQSGKLVSSQGDVVGQVESVRNFTAGDSGDVLALSSAMAGITQELWESHGQIYEVDENGFLISTDLASTGSERIGFVVGRHEDILKMGNGAPSFAYATDTQVLLYDADGIWDSGTKSIGVVQMEGNAKLTTSNIHFGSSPSRETVI